MTYIVHAIPSRLLSRISYSIFTFSTSLFRCFFSAETFLSCHLRDCFFISIRRVDSAISVGKANGSELIS